MQPQFITLIPRTSRVLLSAWLAAFSFCLSNWTAHAQLMTFAGNAQHTAMYSVPAQHLDIVKWSTPIDLDNSGAAAHYGAPLITPANTVIVPVKTTSGFLVKAFEGATGRLKYALTNDYILPSTTNSWISVYQPVIATPPSGPRLYYAGAGGTMFYVDSIDSDTPSAPVRQCFYTNLAGYSSNASAFNATVVINTPLTADTNGVVFFGFRVQNTAPAPLNTTNSGFVRIDPDGNSRYVLAATAAADHLTSRDSHNCAPALSNDGATLYVAVKHYSSANYAYLLGLDSSTLATKYKVLLRDPRNNSFAGILDLGTASPTVGPDGDVYFGVFGNPDNGSRGFLLHFSADLQTKKTPSAFGWDYTPAIVPINMVPGYTGKSTYLLFSKYNNYAGNADGDGINKLALLDPNATQLDPHPSAPGVLEMREVLTVNGCTPDVEYYGSSFPLAVREWCINSAVVNPATKSVFAPSEDGRIYRWNFEVNSLAESFVLSSGFGAPYVPTVLGPDGVIYTLNGGNLYALGGFTNLGMSVSSSLPDLRSVVAGQPLTFTAIVTNLDGSSPEPTGTITFQDVSYHDLSRVTNYLGVNVPLVGGMAASTTSTLSAGSNFLGNHFITAIYNGDSNFPAARVTLVQKVHAAATTLSLMNSAPSNGGPVTFTARVSADSSLTNKPSGMVSFWDGPTFLAQVPLNTKGYAAFTTSGPSGSSQAVTATYASDTLFASSSSGLIVTPPYLTGLSVLGNGAFHFAFSNLIGTPFTVLGSTNILLPSRDWTVLGPATETSPGQFQFTDPQATNDAQKFYRVRWP